MELPKIMQLLPGISPDIWLKVFFGSAGLVLVLVAFSIIYSMKKSQAAGKEVLPNDDPGRVSRRLFAQMSMWSFLGICVASTVKFFFPRILFEPKTTFTIGYPSDYNIGVSTKWQQAHRIWVVRDTGGIYVILAKCTHLGCTPDWKEAENKFKCPCHGSGFDNEGVNFEGPAPRPLDRLEVALDAEGRIVVNAAKMFPTRDDWKKKEAYLVL